MITLSLLLFIAQAQCDDKPKPNIILVLADDIGVNDVSWNNKHADTPTMDFLAKEGVILDNAYTLPVCTPSRAALMTGTYPFKLGLQRGFGRQAPEGVPVNTKMMPEYLKAHGYSTHGLGKAGFGDWIVYIFTVLLSVYDN